MPSVWPAALPQKMRPPGGWRRVDTRALWAPDTGPIHSARTSTLEPRNFSGVELLMSESQFAALELFYDDELGGGNATFQWAEPWAGAGTMIFFFLTPPEPAAWSRAAALPPATSSEAVRLVAGTLNPQRVGRITFDLQWRNP